MCQAKRREKKKSINKLETKNKRENSKSIIGNIGMSTPLLVMVVCTRLEVNVINICTRTPLLVMVVGTRLKVNVIDRDTYPIR